MSLYADYLAVNQDFVAVFSEEVDRTQPSAWKSFIPHEGLVAVLQGLLKALDRSRLSDNKSLWIHGAYGTGKTSAAFVLKHLIEDRWPEVEGYLQTYGIAEDLCRRLQTVRDRGTYVVVYRSSSAHIDTNRKLMAELQQVIKHALEARGFSAGVTPTLYDGVLDKLMTANSPFDWEKAFSKHRENFLDFSSPVQVIDRLRAAGSKNLPETVGLMERVARVLDAEGFLVLDDAERVKSWVKEVIVKNSLKGIIFVWDEFTDYFRNNAGTSSLQELAHAAAEMPFYFLLVTHRSPEILRAGEAEDWKKLLDRFFVFHYEMLPITAYQLMGKAIRVKDKRKDEWEARREALWDRVRKVPTGLGLEFSGAKDMKALIPIHPHAAFLVSTISSQFSSSQRTLFRFLKEKTTGSFPDFLAEYPKPDQQWYTSDALWDYFFINASAELADRVRDVVSYYRTRVDSCQDDEERRVFKAIMLFLALSKEMSGEKRVWASRSNLKLLFWGTSIGEHLTDVTKHLAHKDLIRPLSVGTDEESYTIPLATIDSKQLESLRKKLAQFRSVVETEGEIGKEICRAFSSSNHVELSRQKICVVSTEELESRRNRVVPTLAPYEVGIVLLVVLDEQELDRAKRLSLQLSAQEQRIAYVVAETAFGNHRWEQWKDDKAYADYYETNRDLPNVQFHRRRSAQAIEEWLRGLKQGTLQGYFRNEPKKLSGLVGYEKFVLEIVQSVFTHRPELISSTATLYRGTFGVKGAKVGLASSGVLYNPYKDLAQILTRDGFWDKKRGPADDGFSTHPEHPLSKMKCAVDKAFEGQDNVSLNDLWEMLQEPPFGVRPSPIGIMLMGFLLRDYCDGFYWEDGTNYFPLDHNKMADLITTVMKSTRQEISIHKMTPEAHDFCTLIMDIFGLTEQETKFPENARQALRSHLSKLGYPIWSLDYAADSGGVQRPRSIAHLEQVLSATNLESTTLDTRQLQSLVPDLNEDRHVLMQMVRDREFSEGMRAFLQLTEPELLSVSEQLRHSLPSLMAMLRSMLNEEVWLWKVEKVKERLPELCAQLQLTVALNELNAAIDSTLSDATERLQKKLADARLPYEVVTQGLEGDLCATVESLWQLPNLDLPASRKRALAMELTANKEAVRGAVDDHVGALVRWIKAVFRTTVTLGEAELIWRSLPASEQPDVETTKIRVEQKLEELERQKLANQFCARWLGRTGSASAEDWSRQHRIPLQWVLEGPDYDELFVALRRPQMTGEAALKAGLEILVNRESELQHLCDESAATECFLSVVLQDYRPLLRDQRHVEMLKEHLASRMGTDVPNWQRDQAVRLSRDWVSELYLAEEYEEISREVQSMAESALRRLLADLARDPLVGARLLKAVGRLQ